MSSLTKLFNAALAKIGDERINLPDDQNEEAAIVLNERFPEVRDAVLRAHPWNCATRRLSVPQLTEKPAFGFAVQYTRSADPFDLRVLHLNDRRLRFKVEGRIILTDQSSPLRYLAIVRIDVGEFDSLLFEATAARLAHEVADRLSNDESRQDRMWEVYKRLLDEARSIDGQEGTPDELIDDDFLNSRL